METGSSAHVVTLRRLRSSCRDCSLRSLCLPAGIARSDIEQLDRLVRARVPLDRGEFLFHAGDPFTHLHVVRAGTVRVTLPDADGNEQVIGFHLPGEIIGLEAIRDERHRCDAVALERTSLCMLHFDQLEELAERVPGLQRQLHRLISRELIEDQHHLAALGRRSARERVALFLYSLSERLDTAGHDGSELNLPMSRDDIANYLGLALETVSRELAKLGEDGILKVARRHVWIVDRHRLAAVAGRASEAPRAGSHSGTLGS